MQKLTREKKHKIRLEPQMINVKTIFSKTRRAWTAQKKTVVEREWWWVWEVTQDRNNSDIPPLQCWVRAGSRTVGGHFMLQWLWVSSRGPTECYVGISGYTCKKGCSRACKECLIQINFKLKHRFPPLEKVWSHNRISAKSEKIWNMESVF